MWSYRRRLENDLGRWRNTGWITSEGEAAIRAELAAAGRGPGLAGALAILGVVLLGFGAMSFVAANWQEMSKATRLLLLLAGLWGSYGAAGFLLSRGMTAFAHAAVLLGCAVFGASIMLIAQMYHMDGDPPSAVLWWAIGSLVAGALLQSRPALVLAMILVALWGGWETIDADAVFWPFLLGWGAVTAALAWQRSPAGLHLAAVVLAAWVVSLGYMLNRGHAHGVVVVLGLLTLAFALGAEHYPERVRVYASAALGYGMVVAFCGFFALQFVEERSVGALVLLAGLVLLLMTGAVFWGWRTGRRGPMWLGYTGFSVEILALYFKTIGTLVGSSIFFLTSGLIVIALAFLAYRLHAASEGVPEAVS